MQQEKEVPKGEFLRHINLLESNLSKIKSDIENFSNQEDIHKKSNLITKKIVDKIILDYKNRIFEQKNHLQKEQEIIKEMVDKFEEVLKNKNADIDKLKNSIKEHEEVPGLESIPSEIKKLSKKEVIKSLYQITEENYKFERIIRELTTNIKKKDDSIKKEKLVLEKKFDNLVSEFKFVLKKEMDIKRNFAKLTDEIKILKRQLDKTGELYDERIKKIKADYERKLALNESKLSKLLKIDTRYNNEKLALEKKMKIVSLELNKSLKDNFKSEKLITAMANKIDSLNMQFDKAKELYEERIKKLKESHDLNIKGIIQDKTRDQVNMEALNSTLTHKLGEAKRKLYEKEEREKDFAKEVESRLRSLISPMISEVITNASKKDAYAPTETTEDLLPMKIRESFQSGDTKEKIISDLAREGHDSKDIRNTIEKIK